MWLGQQVIGPYGVVAGFLDWRGKPGFAPSSPPPSFPTATKALLSSWPPSTTPSLDSDHCQPLSPVYTGNTALRSLANFRVYLSPYPHRGLHTPTVLAFGSVMISALPTHVLSVTPESVRELDGREALSKLWTRELCI